MPPSAVETSQDSGTNKEQTVKPGTAESIMTPDSLIFHPMELGDDSVIVAKALLPPVVKTGGGPAKQAPAPPAEIPVIEKEVPGFRVQIYATSSHEAARQMEQQAALEFEEGVYMVYDPPTYKIRIGNCQTHAQADALKAKAAALGYHDAWIVRDNVMVKSGGR
ncbi:SPOR domain-containing protein [bacterium]|nr:SPOR domain-containing protein [bacterium]